MHPFSAAGTVNTLAAAATLEMVNGSVPQLVMVSWMSRKVPTVTGPQYSALLGLTQSAGAATVGSTKAIYPYKVPW